MSAFSRFMSRARSPLRRAAAAAGALAVAVAGLSAGSAAAAGSSSAGMDGCVGQLVSVDAKRRVVTTDITGTSTGATAHRRGIDGTLPFTPQAFAFAGEAGDIGSGSRVHFAVSPSGRLHRFLVSASMDGDKYVAKMSSRMVGRGFTPAAMAAQVDMTSGGEGYVYVLSKFGELRRYSYSEGAGLGRGRVVANGLSDVRTLTFGRVRTVEDRDGTSAGAADVLLSTGARSGALREIVVPYEPASKGVLPYNSSKSKVVTLASSGWGGYSQVGRLLCDGNRGGFVAVKASGEGMVASDAKIDDLSGADIRKVGSLRR